MIFYLVTAKGRNAMEHYVSSWGPVSESRIRFLFYDDLPGIRSLTPGTYIFSDLERLSPAGLKSVCQAWDALSAAGSRVRLLNDPSRVLCRYDLLRKLFDEGKNSFNVIRASGSLESPHYPVFVREENEHTGSLTPLIHSQRELVSGLRTLRLQGYPLRDLLVVEFCDTSGGAGVFRKYSAFIVGGEIIPRHVIFSCHWEVKKPDLVDPHLAGEQEEYLNVNPHKSWLKETFKLSGIEYGRIDYSLLGDMPQVWEINTNPTVRKLTPRLTAAFEAIDSKMDSGPTIPFTVERKLAEVIAIEKRRQRNRQRFRRMVGSLTSNQLVRPLVPMMKSFVRYWSR
jgi:hypothetical protein